MTIGIVAAVIGVLIAAAAVGIPMLVSRHNRPEDHADSRGYLEETGRSAEDIRRDNDAGSQRAGGLDGPSPCNGAGSRETS